jgi:hypothetical protein
MPSCTRQAAYNVSHLAASTSTWESAIIPLDGLVLRDRLPLDLQI